MLFSTFADSSPWLCSEYQLRDMDTLPATPEIDVTDNLIGEVTRESSMNKEFPMYSYKYQQLDHKGAIRLLKLMPSKSILEDVHCELITVYLDLELHYEAVSYTWGEPTFSETLYSTGGVIKITRNLMSALQHFRLPHKLRTLWIDAVCINQLDLVKKSYQITLMAGIYKNALRALAWLGE